MKVLLTGGTGFVGINIAEKLLSEGMDVVFYALNPLIDEAEQAFQKCKGNYFFVHGDILDQNLLDLTIKQYNITTVIHGAAITPDVQRELTAGRTILNVNCMGTVEALETARKNNIEKFIHLSSISAYGKTASEDDILKEDGSIMKPEDLYEISKYTAERIAIRYKHLLGMNLTAVRMGHIFGPWEHHSGVRDVMSPLFQTTRLATLGEKAFLSRPGYTSWVYSRDIAASLYALLKADTLKHDVYNLGYRQVWSVEEWCQLLEKKYPAFSYEITNDAEKINTIFRPDNAPLQIDRLIDDIGYVPHFDIEKSFEDYTNWVEKHPVFLTKK